MPPSLCLSTKLNPVFLRSQVLTQQKRTFIERLKLWSKTKDIKIKRKSNMLWCHSIVKLHCWLALPDKFSERIVFITVRCDCQPPDCQHKKVILMSNCETTTVALPWYGYCPVWSQAIQSKVTTVCCCDCDYLCVFACLSESIFLFGTFISVSVCLSLRLYVCLPVCWFPFHHKQLKTLMNVHSRTHTWKIKKGIM